VSSTGRIAKLTNHGTQSAAISS